MSYRLTPDELRVWLEWAGARLIAMPGGRIGPANYKVYWPEFSQETFQVLEFRKIAPLRASAPSKDEIPLVDEILTFPSVCKDIYTRRVLHVRALVHPVNHRYLYKWTRIAELLHTDRQTVRNWHAKGLREVVAKADPVKVCRIAFALQNIT
jgi:hypothetical protein